MMAAAVVVHAHPPFAAAGPCHAPARALIFFQKRIVIDRTGVNTDNQTQQERRQEEEITGGCVPTRAAGRRGSGDRNRSSTGAGEGSGTWTGSSHCDGGGLLDSRDRCRGGP